MSSQLREGVTATDLVLHITQLLRAQKVVGNLSSLRRRRSIASGP